MSITSDEFIVVIIMVEVKLDMNRYRQRETADIFFSIEPISKIGYWLGVWHG